MEWSGQHHTLTTLPARNGTLYQFNMRLGWLHNLSQHFFRDKTALACRELNHNSLDAQPAV